MLPHAPPMERPGSAPPRRQQRECVGKEVLEKRKAYIKKHGLHVVLGEKMELCLNELPDEPALYLATLLLEEGCLRSTLVHSEDNAERISRLRDEAAHLKGIVMNGVLPVEVGKRRRLSKILEERLHGTLTHEVKIPTAEAFYAVLQSRSQDIYTVFSDADHVKGTSRLLGLLKEVVANPPTLGTEEFHDTCATFQKLYENLHPLHCSSIGDAFLQAVTEMEPRNTAPSSLEDKLLYLRVLSQILMLLIPTYPNTKRLELAWVIGKDSDILTLLSELISCKNLTVLQSESNVKVQLVAYILEALQECRLLEEMAWIAPWAACIDATHSEIVNLASAYLAEDAQLEELGSDWVSVLSASIGLVVNNNKREILLKTSNVLNVQVGALRSMILTWLKAPIDRKVFNEQNWGEGVRGEIICDAFAATITFLNDIGLVRAVLGDMLQEDLPGVTSMNKDSVQEAVITYLLRSMSLSRAAENAVVTLLGVIMPIAAADARTPTIEEHIFPRAPPAQVPVGGVAESWVAITEKAEFVNRVLVGLGLSGISAPMLFYTVDSIIRTLGTPQYQGVIKDLANHQLLGSEPPCESLLASVFSTELLRYSSKHTPAETAHWVVFFQSLPWGSSTLLVELSYPLVLSIASKPHWDTFAYNILARLPARYSEQEREEVKLFVTAVLSRTTYDDLTFISTCIPSLCEVVRESADEYDFQTGMLLHFVADMIPLLVSREKTWSSSMKNSMRSSSWRKLQFAWAHLSLRPNQYLRFYNSWGIHSLLSLMLNTTIPLEERLQRAETMVAAIFEYDLPNVDGLAAVFKAEVGKVNAETMPRECTAIAVAWLRSLFGMVQPVSTPNLPVQWSVQRQLVASWDAVHNEKFVEKLTVHFAPHASDFNRAKAATQSACLCLHAICHVGYSPCLNMLHGSSEIFTSEETYVCFCDSFFDVLDSSGSNVSPAEKATLLQFFNIVKSFMLRTPCAETPPWFDINVTCLSAMHWASFRDVRYGFACMVLQKLEMATVSSEWNTLSRLTAASRLLYYIDIQFSGANQPMLLQCAGERWQNVPVCMKVVSAIIATLRELDSHITEEVVDAWQAVLLPTSQYMQQNILYTSDLPPPTHEDVTTLGSCTLTEQTCELFRRNLLLIDPSLPSSMADRTFAVVIEAIDDLGDCDNEMLSYLMPTDFNCSLHILSVLQALLRSLPALSTGETLAWMRMFRYRIAPQLLWEQEHDSNREDTTALWSDIATESVHTTWTVFVKKYRSNSPEVAAVFWKNVADIDSAVCDSMRDSDEYGKVFQFFDAASVLCAEWRHKDMCLAPYAMYHSFYGVALQAFLMTLEQLYPQEFTPAQSAWNEVVFSMISYLETLNTKLVDFALRWEYSVENNIVSTQFTSGINFTAVSVTTLRAVSQSWKVLNKTKLLANLRWHLSRCSLCTEGTFREVLERLMLSVFDNFIADLGKDAITSIGKQIRQMCTTELTCVLRVQYQQLVMCIVNAVTSTLTEQGQTMAETKVGEWMDMTGLFVRTIINIQEECPKVPFEERVKKLKTETQGKDWKKLHEVIERKREFIVATITAIRNGVHASAKAVIEAVLVLCDAFGSHALSAIQKAVLAFKKIREMTDDGFVMAVGDALSKDPAQQQFSKYWVEVAVAVQALNLKDQFDQKIIPTILSIGGKMYDLSDWVDVHPGGAQVLECLTGSDATVAFMQAHGTDARVKEMLKYFYIPERRRGSKLLTPDKSY